MQLDDVLRELEADGWTVISKPYSQPKSYLEGASGQDRIHYSATKPLGCDSWEISFSAANRAIVAGPHFAFWLSIIDRKTAYSDTTGYDSFDKALNHVHFYEPDWEIRRLARGG
jgi:hypothetical protein